MPIKSYFPTLIYSAPLLADKGKLKKLVLELNRDSEKIFANDHNGQKWSKSHYANGYSSYSSEANLHEVNSTFIDLRLRIDAHVKSFARSLGFGAVKLAMESCWLNIMPPAATHSLHLHPLSVISGTFYLATPPGGGAIKFEDPRLSKFMTAPARQDKFSSGGFARFTPEVGEVLLFESWLRHEVEVNSGKANRISLSFNYASV